MDRRRFVEAVGAATGGILAAGCGGGETGQDRSGRRLDRIGLQLYTVRDQMQQSVPHTLGAVAELGYTEVEFVGYFGHAPSEIRAFLDEYGLEAPAAHIPLGAVRRAPAETVAMALEIGHRFLIVPSLPGDQRTRDGYQRLADDLNAFGAQCRSAGLVAGYHNHAFEFERVDGELAYDILLDACDPELVTMELDLFWIRRGGFDPLPYFARYPGRFGLCHVKDMDASETMVDVGAGVIDFGQIFARSEQAGLQHYFVEHDSPGDSLASIERSYRHLADLRF